MVTLFAHAALVAPQSSTRRVNQRRMKPPLTRLRVKFDEDDWNGPSDDLLHSEYLSFRCRSFDFSLIRGCTMQSTAFESTYAEAKNHSARLQVARATLEGRVLS